MTLLSVNLNKVALIRNSRGRNYPDLVQVALDCVRFGADGITLHPRPDERHARKSDVYALKEALGETTDDRQQTTDNRRQTTDEQSPLDTLSSGDPGAERRENRVAEGGHVELNVEGYPSEDFLRLIEATRPAQCTLVPDAPDALTSNAGWDTRRHAQFLLDVVLRIQAAGVRVSLFVEPDLEAIEGAREIGADRIELYTEHFASAFALGDTSPVEAYARSAAYAHELGLGVNAGHDLNLHNLAHFVQHVPHVAEVSIGHALVTDALYLGFEETIRRYQGCLGK